MKHSRFQVARYGWQRGLPDTCFVSLLRRFGSLNLAAQSSSNDEMLVIGS
jgi:hypothetical protein